MTKNDMANLQLPSMFRGTDRKLFSDATSHFNGGNKLMIDLDLIVLLDGATI